MTTEKRVKDLSKRAEYLEQKVERSPQDPGDQSQARGYLYAEVAISNGTKTCKVRLSDFQTVATISHPAYCSAYSNIIVDDYLYVLFNNLPDPPSIAKIDLTNFSPISTLPVGGTTDPFSMTYYEGYLYLGSITSPGRIDKIDLASFTNVGHLDLLTGENYITDLLPYQNILYVVCRTQPTKVVKIDLSSFTRIGSLTLNSDERNGALINYYNEHLYVTTNEWLWGSYPSKVVRIDIASFEREGAFSFSTANNEKSVGFDSAVVCGKYLYVGFIAQANTDIVRVNLNTFTRDSEIFLLPEEQYIEALIAKDNVLYAGLQATDPCAIVRALTYPFVRYDRLQPVVSDGSYVTAMTHD